MEDLTEITRFLQRVVLQRVNSDGDPIIRLATERDVTVHLRLQDDGTTLIVNVKDNFE